MMKILIGIIVVSNCFIRWGEPTNKFLRTLLTTTPSASHISDFRHQRRTDSRADKPDTFPGFDLDETTTLSPRKRRRQAYSQLIRGLLEKTRERLDTIRDVVKEEKQLRFHLNADENDAEKMRNAEVVSVFEFTDPNTNGENVNDDLSSHISPMPFAYTSSVPQKYFSSLLGAIGFNRIIPSAAGTTKNQNLEDKRSGNGRDDGGRLFATYLFNPLLDIWHSARKKLNFNLNERRNGDAAIANSNANANDDNSDELQFTIVYDDSSHAANASAKNGNGNDNVNQLLALISAESSYTDDSNIENIPSSNNTITKFNNKNNTSVTIDGNAAAAVDDVSNIKNNSRPNTNTTNTNEIHLHNNNKRNAPPSNIERAAFAFQNAFFKYSNYMPTSSPSTTMTTTTHDGAAGIVDAQVFGPSNKSTSMHNNAVGTDGNGLLANFLDDSRSNIQIVPSAKSKINDTTTAADVDDNHPSKRQSLESAGILVLEMFGTVIGLTWGAFSHVQSYFNNNRNNETMST